MKDFKPKDSRDLTANMSKDQNKDNIDAYTRDAVYFVYKA